MNARSAPGHPTAERAAEIANAIVVATLTLFSRHGSNFSMDEVARVGGMSKQAIYRRFDTKQALLQFALETGSAILVSDVTDELPDDPLEALEMAAFRLFERGGPDGIGVTMHLEAEAIGSPAFRAILFASRRTLEAAVMKRIAAVASIDRLTEGPVAVKAHVLVDLLLGANIRLNMEQRLTASERKSMFAERWAVFCQLAIR